MRQMQSDVGKLCPAIQDKKLPTSMQVDIKYRVWAIRKQGPHPPW